ncbi:S8 family serine peptidase [Flavitalea flava]
MIKSRVLSLFLFAGLIIEGQTVSAQILTNRHVLQNASKDRALKEADLHRILLTTAKQKGWPLILHNKTGRMAYLMAVDAKGFPLYTSTTENIISAATIGTTQLWPGGNTGLNLNGSSSNMTGRLAVWDEGLVRPTHVELVGRVTQQDGSTEISDHSTHVAGTMIAAGINPVAKGMSFGAKDLQCFDFFSDVSEMMAAAGSSTNPLLISNHSYATIAGWYFNSDQNRWEFYGNPGDTVDYKFGYYDQETQVWDSIAYNAPDYLIVKAAGNNRGETGPDQGKPYYRYDNSGTMSNAGNRPAGLSSNNGYQIIATYGCAKNILTIGAVGPIPGGYTKPSDVVLTDFSSWGPTGDGRIKPDVVADGLNVLSSVGSADNAYDIFSGTSMASPATAGSAFLLQEYYSKRYPGNFMRSATLKGLLIHTADEAGPNPGPDYQYGWGLVNMQKAAAVITSGATAVVRDSLHLLLQNNLVNGTHDFDSLFVVASGTSPLIATISWTDPAAVPANATGSNFADVTPKLINDLDIRITDSVTGTVYLPWKLNPQNRPAAATTGDNILDNVEKIQVDSLIPGRTYKIKVTHKRVLARGAQAYSLLVSGVGGKTYCASASTGAAGTRIDKVIIGGINNTNAAGCKTYSDFTGLPAAILSIGQNVPVSITSGSCDGSNNNRIITVYIDFNNNGNFADAGEMVYQSPAGPSGTASSTLLIPATVKVGSASRMRIIAQETSTPGLVSPCGIYPVGETQDYRVLFATASNDVGVTGLQYPTITTCASDSQLVAIRIRNFGATPRNSVPVTTVIKNGGTTVATLSAICKDSIPPGNEVVFTYNTSFPSIAGTTYTFISSTSLAGDPNNSNDQNTTTLTVSATASTLSGTATLCSATSTQANLKATTSGNDLALWYTSATATTPVAAGNNTTTTVIPSDKTYYLGVNDLNTKAGPPNKLSYSDGAGAYFRMGGNFVQLTTSVPLTIESAKMYIGHSGRISFTLATLVSYTRSGYSYIPLYNSTIDVYATKTVSDTSHQIDVAAGDNSDTGAVYYLNIPIPTPGNYIILIDCQNYASAFLNSFPTSSTSTIPYPITVPGVISITGNDFRDYPNADSLTFYKKFYFPFYNMGIRLSGCPGPRVPVTVHTPTAPVITLNGNVLTSDFTSGNQWYRSSTLIPGATGQTDTAIYSGLYQSVVTDPATGCTLYSNQINFTSTGTNDINGTAIGLKAAPNPNPGVFQLSFYLGTQDNLSISLFNTLGQQVYLASYPNFVGQFNQQINAGNLAAGMYVLKIAHGSDNYIKKIIVRH